MLKRNAPVLAFLLVFIAVLYFIYSVPHYEPIVDIREEKAEAFVLPFDSNAFCGRVEMPSLDEIYVLDNTAGRDLNRIAMFLQGRAAGLHFLSSEYFQKSKPPRNRKGKSKGKGKKDHSHFKSDDGVFLGLRLSLDSLGRFKNPQIMFSDTDDKVFKVKLLQHIEYFWRMPPSKQGSLEMWIPIRFHAKI